MMSTSNDLYEVICTCLQYTKARRIVEEGTQETLYCWGNYDGDVCLQIWGTSEPEQAVMADLSSAQARLRYGPQEEYQDCERLGDNGIWYATGNAQQYKEVVLDRRRLRQQGIYASEIMWHELPDYIRYLPAGTTEIRTQQKNIQKATRYILEYHYWQTRRETPGKIGNRTTEEKYLKFQQETGEEWEAYKKHHRDRVQKIIKQKKAEREEEERKGYYDYEKQQNEQAYDEHWDRTPKGKRKKEQMGKRDEEKEKSSGSQRRQVVQIGDSGERKEVGENKEQKTRDGRPEEGMGCYLEDSEIEMVNGRVKKIQEFEVGDKIIYRIGNMDGQERVETRIDMGSIK